MENEDTSVKTENMGEEGSVQQKNHGFSTHSSGTWNQDELISTAKKLISTAEDSKADLPPKINSTKREG
jgi:hypothetical protein